MHRDLGKLNLFWIQVRIVIDLCYVFWVDRSKECFNSFRLTLVLLYKSILAGDQCLKFFSCVNNRFLLLPAAVLKTSINHVSQEESKASSFSSPGFCEKTDVFRGGSENNSSKTAYWIYDERKLYQLGLQTYTHFSLLFYWRWGIAFFVANVCVEGGKKRRKEPLTINFTRYT